MRVSLGHPALPEGITLSDDVKPGEDAIDAIRRLAGVAQEQGFDAASVAGEAAKRKAGRALPFPYPQELLSS